MSIRHLIPLLTASFVSTAAVLATAAPVAEDARPAKPQVSTLDASFIDFLVEMSLTDGDTNRDVIRSRIVFAQQASQQGANGKGDGHAAAGQASSCDKQLFTEMARGDGVLGQSVRC